VQRPVQSLPAFSTPGDTHSQPASSPRPLRFFMAGGKGEGEGLSPTSRCPQFWRSCFFSRNLAVLPRQPVSRLPSSPVPFLPPDSSICILSCLSTSALLCSVSKTRMWREGAERGSGHADVKNHLLYGISTQHGRTWQHQAGGERRCSLAGPALAVVLQDPINDHQFQSPGGGACRQAVQGWTLFSPSTWRASPLVPCSAGHLPN